jgi:hypothetical protein
MTDEGRALANQAQTIRSLISTAASLWKGLVSLRRKKSAPAGEKPLWWQSILKGAQFASSLWSEFHSRCHRQDEK